MTRKILLFLIATALLPAAATAQVVDFGLAAGYSMNDEALRLKGSSTTTWLGVNHGFYAGPQVDFNLGKNFSLRTGLYFRRAGSHMFLDLEKLAVNFNQIALDVEDGNKLVFDYLKEHPDLDLGGVTSEQVLAGIDTYHEYAERAVTTLKGSDLTMNTDRYGLTLPVLLRYTSGRLSVNAGVHLQLVLFNNIDLTANLPGGVVYSDKDLEKLLPYAHMVLTQTPPTEENPRMKAERFYHLDVSHDFTVGLQVGVDYAVSDRISLQLSYLHGLRSDIRQPWTDLFTLKDRAVQAGVVYHFRFKNKKQKALPDNDL